jgi:hypothetical protein
VATNTTNYNLVKPLASELYDVAVVNTNSDTIDTTLFAKVDKVTGKGLSTEDYTTTEKSKLGGIQALAEVNQLAYTNIEVTGQPTVTSASKTGTFKLVKGSNINITTNNTTKEVTISATGTLGGSVNAVDVLVTDSGDYFSGTQVEGILQEVGLSLSTLGTPSAEDITYDNATSLLVATDVQGAIDEVVGLIDDKQDELVSGTSIKTINSTTLLGSGDITVQPTLVSGTNIKSINSSSILSSGDLTLATYTVYTATIPSASWTGSSAPYSKAVTLTGILSTDEPIIDLVFSGTYATDVTMRENWSKVYRIVTTANTITCYADSVPSADISIQLVVVR